MLTSKNTSCLLSIWIKIHHPEHDYSPDGGTGGSSTKLEAGIAQFSRPPVISSHTKLWQHKSTQIRSYACKSNSRIIHFNDATFIPA